MLGVGLANSGLTSDYFVSKRFVYNLFGAGFTSIFCGELFAGLEGLTLLSGFMVYGVVTCFKGCGGTTGLTKVLFFGGITG